MEISDYIANCMSLESARDFLDMKGENLRDFDPILITVDTLPRLLNRNVQAYEALARVAMVEGCKYVTSVELTPVLRGWTEKRIEYVAGTGLVPKEK